MAKSGIIGYGIAFGVGLGLGYALFSQQQATTAPSPPSVATQNVVGTRWTSGYQGSFATGFPEAGVTEALYPYNEMHKMTQLTPYATTQSATNGTNGSIIYID